MVDCLYSESSQVKMRFSFLIMFVNEAVVSVSVVSGRSEPAPGGPGGGLPPQNAHRAVLPGETRRHHLPLRVLVGARPSDVPLRPGAGPRRQRVSHPPLPRALHPQGRIQRLLPSLPGRCFVALGCLSVTGNRKTVRSRHEATSFLDCH